MVILVVTIKVNRKFTNTRTAECRKSTSKRKHTKVYCLHGQRAMSRKSGRLLTELRAGRLQCERGDVHQKAGEP